jgi:hypothetical protein
LIETADPMEVELNGVVVAKGVPAVITVVW